MGKVVRFRAPASLAPGPLFEAAWQAFPPIGRQRSSRKEASIEWAAVACKITEDELLAAVRRFAAESKDLVYTPGFHRWLRNGRWEYWADAPSVAVTPVIKRFPDESLRASFHTRFPDDRARRWFDNCTWDAESREITGASAAREAWTTGPFRAWAIENGVAALLFR